MKWERKEYFILTLNLPYYKKKLHQKSKFSSIHIDSIYYIKSSYTVGSEDLANIKMITKKKK